MHDITLTDAEWEAAKQIARDRQANKERHGVASGKVDSEQTDLGIHEVGAAGELAVSKFLGPSAEPNTDIFVSGDDGEDVALGPLSVEVKTRQGTEKDFAMYDATTDLEADIGVLVWRKSEKEYTLAGWISKPEWRLLKQKMWFGPNPRLGVEWNHMRPMSQLKDTVNMATRE